MGEKDLTSLIVLVWIIFAIVVVGIIAGFRYLYKNDMIHLPRNERGGRKGPILFSALLAFSIWLAWFVFTG